MTLGHEALTFLHISDLHLRTYEDPPNGLSAAPRSDLDDDLRTQLLRDVGRLAQRVGAFGGILVSGDVAFSGKSEEYAVANNYLSRLCTQIGCKESGVWVIPGNHDVVRAVISKSPALQALHHDLRTKPAEQLGDYIQELIRDPVGAAILNPFQPYNVFARAYGCASEPAHLYWDSPDIRLNDGSRLRIRGLNSVLVSDASDNDQNKKMVLGEHQVRFEEADDLVHIVMCHHPSDWIRDWDRVETFLNRRTAVQLYGHKHVQRSEQINGSVRVRAGALHPSRNEAGWNPRYNMLRIAVVGVDTQRRLIVEVWARTWDTNTARFKADAVEYNGGIQEFERYELPLPSWTAPVSAAGVEALAALTAEENAQVQAKRQLVYRFMTLPYTKRMQAALELHLLHDEDDELSDQDVPQQILKRAEQADVLAQLWDKIDQLAPEPGLANPFRK